MEKDSKNRTEGCSRDIPGGEEARRNTGHWDLWIKGGAIVFGFLFVVGYSDYLGFTANLGLGYSGLVLNERDYFFQGLRLVINPTATWGGILTAFMISGTVGAVVVLLACRGSASRGWTNAGLVKSLLMCLLLLLAVAVTYGNGRQRALGLRLDGGNTPLVQLRFSEDGEIGYINGRLFYGNDSVVAVGHVNRFKMKDADIVGTDAFRNKIFVFEKSRLDYINIYMPNIPGQEQ